MKQTASALLMCLLLSLLGPAAHAQELALGGQVVGIQIETEGVVVVGLSQVETENGSVCPARDAGVCVGDQILSLDGGPVARAGDLIEGVTRASGRAVELELRREEKDLKVLVTPVRSAEDQWMLGLWLRDGVAGIGTLTFCDPDTGIYGALGHSVSEQGGEPLPIASGSICRAEIVGVSRGEAGAPGELNGCSDEGRVLGSIEKNSAAGIFGHAAGLGGRPVETGLVHTGPASILTTVSGSEQREFAIEITRVFHDSAGCHVTLKVTDPELRELTGGIVQGMSGSPILQEGKLVAAVTHVFLSDPGQGYGLSIQDMLREAGLGEEQAA